MTKATLTDAERNFIDAYYHEHVVRVSMKRWRLEELRGWCEAGCPPRKEWESMATADAKGR